MAVLTPAEEYDAMLAVLRDRGLGGTMGFGERPALMIVDMQKGFTDPDSPLGATADREMEAVRRLLESARSTGVPVVFTAVRYAAGAVDAGVWARKIPGNLLLVEGSELVELDPRLERRPDELVLYKKLPSAFFGTGLDGHLAALGVDSVVIGGLTTSGCVRATAMDACGHGLRPSVVREAVGDRRELPHLASLFDIELKYADVVSVEDAVVHLGRATHKEDR
jgi:nicotinamidase-related amidase